MKKVASVLKHRKLADGVTVRIIGNASLRIIVDSEDSKFLLSMAIYPRRIVALLTAIEVLLISRNG